VLKIAIDTKTVTATIDFDPQMTNVEKIMRALESANFEVYRKPVMLWKSPKVND
jgi:hypothetical protein